MGCATVSAVICCHGLERHVAQLLGGFFGQDIDQIHAGDLLNRGEELERVLTALHGPNLDVKRPAGLKPLGGKAHHMTSGVLLPKKVSRRFCVRFSAWAKVQQASSLISSGADTGCFGMIQHS